MKSVVSALAVLVFTVAAFAAPPKLDLPTEVKGEKGEFVVLRAETPGKIVKWVPLDKGLSILPPELLNDPKTLVVLGNTPGKYRVLAYTAVADEASNPAICTVTINGTAPEPDPEPPAPDDALTKSFKTAYGQETAVDKRERLVALISAMSSAVDMAGDPLYPTNEAFTAAVKLKTDGTVTAGALIKVRSAIGAYLNGVLPTDKVDLTDTVRTKYKAEYAKVVAALKKIN